MTKKRYPSDIDDLMLYDMELKKVLKENIEKDIYYSIFFNFKQAGGWLLMEMTLRDLVLQDINYLQLMISCAIEFAYRYEEPDFETLKENLLNIRKENELLFEAFLHQILCEQDSYSIATKVIMLILIPELMTKYPNLSQVVFSFARKCLLSLEKENHPDIVEYVDIIHDVITVEKIDKISREYSNLNYKQKTRLILCIWVRNMLFSDKTIKAPDSLILLK